VRAFTFVVVAALATGGLALFAPEVDAASNTKFCKAVENISSADPTKASAARNLAKATRKAAKFAPTKVKKALNTMAEYYDAVADAGNDPAKLADVSDLVEEYTKAFGVYTSYYVKTCVNVN
jgi:hypothetical protein